MSELTAAERRRAQRLARPPAQPRSSMVAQPDVDAPTSQVAADRTGVVDARADEDGFVELAEGEMLPRDAGRTKVRVGNRFYIDNPSPTARCGRERLNVTKTVTVPVIGPLVLEAIERRGRSKSPQWWRRERRAACLLLNAVEQLKLDGDPASLPHDFCSHVGALLLARQQRQVLSASGEMTINDCRRLVRLLPGTRHVDTDFSPKEKQHKVAGQEKFHQHGALDDNSLERLLKGCMAEIAFVRAREKQVSDLVLTDVEAEGPLGRELLVAAAWMRRSFPGGPPNVTEFAAANRRHYRRLSSIGWLEIVRAAYPMARDMVPFAAVLGLYTRLNASVLSSLRFDAFKVVGELGPGVGHFDLASPEESEAMGVEPKRLVAEPFKGRSRRGQRVDFPITSDLDNPAVLIDFILDWTRSLRGHAGRHDEELFLVMLEKNRGCGSFNEVSFRQLNRALSGLCDRVGVRIITARELRPIGVDIVHDATGGDRMMIKAAGWWRDVDTAERHYLGPAARLREDEDLAWAKILERRRLKAGIDASARPGTADRGAATPGFICYDPFDGPFPQPAGELCRAIGHCAICPNSDVDETSPWACAQLVALSAKIDEMAGEIAPDAWSERFEPIQVVLLDDWLPLFSRSVVEDAARSALVTFPDFIFNKEDDDDD